MDSASAIVDASPQPEHRLPELFDAADALREKLRTIPGRDPVYQATIEEACSLLVTADRLVQDLQLFSDGEDYSEHSTTSLRYVLIPAIHAELYSKVCPSPDDPERDDKRIVVLEKTKELMCKFLENCVELGLAMGPLVNKYIEMKEKPPQNRDSKVASLRTKMAADAKLKALADQMQNVKMQSGIIDEDLERNHMLATIDSWVLKACGQIEMGFSELEMIESMAAHRAATPNTGDSGPAAPTTSPREQESPFVITKEMIAEMSRTGVPFTRPGVNRAEFKLVNRGYGPIGAPTMSMKEYADKEMREMAERTLAQARADAAKVELDPDSEEAVEAERQKKIEWDKYKDHTRRGDGNRYNMG